MSVIAQAHSFVKLRHGNLDLLLPEIIQMYLRDLALRCHTCQDLGWAAVFLRGSCHENTVFVSCWEWYLNWRSRELIFLECLSLVRCQSRLDLLHQWKGWAEPDVSEMFSPLKLMIKLLGKVLRCCWFCYLTPCCVALISAPIIFGGRPQPFFQFVLQFASERQRWETKPPFLWFVLWNICPKTYPTVPVSYSLSPA